ncbi:FRG domain-containing protein [Halochromatium sp.]
MSPAESTSGRSASEPSTARPNHQESVTASSWTDIQELLFAESWVPEIGRFRSRYAYRGLSDVDYPLETTLMRLGGNYAQLERHLLRNFRKYAHQRVVERDSVWHWLSVAQHYGLPTRLMDWTYSPFAALHFATAHVDKIDRDGAIWGVNYIDTHRMAPDLLRTRLDLEGANVFTVEMLSEAVSSLSAFDRLSETPFTIFFEPPSIDDRIVNQFAFFSLSSDPTLAMDRWLADYPVIWRRIIIPAELKWEIRDKLDQSNITERVFFPGLEGLTAWLKRHYSPRG